MNHKHYFRVGQRVVVTGDQFALDGLGMRHVIIPQVGQIDIVTAFDSGDIQLKASRCKNGEAWWWPGKHFTPVESV